MVPFRSERGRRRGETISWLRGGRGWTGRGRIRGRMEREGDERARKILGQWFPPVIDDTLDSLTHSAWALPLFCIDPDRRGGLKILYQSKL